MGLFDFLKTNPVEVAKGALDGAGKVVESVGTASTRIREAITGDIPSDVKVKLEEIASDLEKEKIELDKTIIETTNQINLEYAKKSGWFYSGWRPAFGWLLWLAFAENYVLFPIINFILQEVFKIDLSLNIDISALYPLTLSILGLASLRTVEKKNGVHNEH